MPRVVNTFVGLLAGWVGMSCATGPGSGDAPNDAGSGGAGAGDSIVAVGSGGSRAAAGSGGGAPSHDASCTSDVGEHCGNVLNPCECKAGLVCIFPPDFSGVDVPGTCYSTYAPDGGDD